MNSFTSVVRKATVCNNGVILSIQASNFHYCSPRRNLESKCYYEFEVGYISDSNNNRIAAPESWKEYAEDGTLLSNVFAYVPKQLIVDFIKENGGIKYSEFDCF